MSFQMPSQRQEQQRNKILEDLQKRQQLLKQQSTQGQTQAIGSQSTQQLSQQSSQQNVSQESPLSSSQRAALQHANNNSFGFFITQDSSFGNLILPVLPRV